MEAITNVTLVDSRFDSIMALPTIIQGFMEVTLSPTAVEVVLRMVMALKEREE